MSTASPPLKSHSLSPRLHTARTPANRHASLLLLRRRPPRQRQEPRRKRKPSLLLLLLLLSSARLPARHPFAAVTTWARWSLTVLSLNSTQAAPSCSKRRHSLHPPPLNRSLQQQPPLPPLPPLPLPLPPLPWTPAQHPCEHRSMDSRTFEPSEAILSVLSSLPNEEPKSNIKTSSKN